MKIKVEIEVPDGEYCMKRVWDDEARKSKEVYRCNHCVAGTDYCKIFDCPLVHTMLPEFVAFEKLPACLEAGEEVQRG